MPDNADTAEPQFCDNCGESWDGFAAYSEVPVDVASANEGDSAVLCRPCCAKLGLHHNDDSETPVQEPIPSNPDMYPHGRCPVCGWGVNWAARCMNEDCQEYAPGAEEEE